MKRLKKLIMVTPLLLCCLTNMQAQDTTDKKKKMAPSLFAHNSMERVGPNAVVIKGGIKHPHVFEFYLNGNATFPSGTNVTSAARFNPSLGIDYIFENNIVLGLEGSYLTANPSLDFDNYASAFANNAAFPQNNTNSSYKSTSVFLNGGYSLKLKRADILRHEALNFVIGGGVVFNSYPEQSISGFFNGTTYSIFSNTPPNGYSKTNFALKPKIEFVYMINDWIGFNVNAQYQVNLGSKDYAYSYKDLTNVDFTKPIDIVYQKLYEAPTITQSTKGITGSFSIGGGFVFALGRNKGDYRHGKGVIDIKQDPMGRTTKPNGEDDGKAVKYSGDKLDNVAQVRSVKDNLRAITIQNLPNPSEHINGGPNLIVEPAIDCICTETHGGTCDSDWGEICGCDGYQTDRTSHGSFYIPKDYLDSTPFLVYQAKPKNNVSLENKELIITTKIKLDKKIAGAIGVDEVAILPGVYTFTKENLVSLPLAISVTSENPFYHAVNKKGLPGSQGPPPCSCSCCEKSPGAAWKCCTN